MNWFFFFFFINLIQLWAMFQITVSALRSTNQFTTWNNNDFHYYTISWSIKMLEIAFKKRQSELKYSNRLFFWFFSTNKSSVCHPRRLGKPANSQIQNPEPGISCIERRYSNKSIVANTAISFLWLQPLTSCDNLPLFFTLLRVHIIQRVSAHFTRFKKTWE